MDKVMEYLVPIVVFLFLIAAGSIAMDINQLAADPMVSVKMYKHIESGEPIYCITGEITGDKHTYVGETMVRKSEAGHC